MQVGDIMVEVVGILVELIFTRGSIWFDVTAARSVGDRKIEPVEEKKPACLTGV